MKISAPYGASGSVGRRGNNDLPVPSSTPTMVSCVVANTSAVASYDTSPSTTSSAMPSGSTPVANPSTSLASTTATWEPDTIGAKSTTVATDAPGVSNVMPWV